MKDLSQWPSLSNGKPARTGWIVESCPVRQNQPVHDDVWRLLLEAPQIARAARPGQFVMVVAGSGYPFLPRAMAPMRFGSDGVLEIYYRIVGDGTKQMARAREGERLDVIGPLGTPWSSPAGSSVALVGRGVGITPLYPIAENVVRLGGTIRTYLSARAPDLLLGQERFLALGPVYTHHDQRDPNTLITDQLEQHLAHGFNPKMVVVSGAHRLLQAVYRLQQRYGFDAKAFVEEKMACGIGWCKGCAIGREWHLICTDGPALPLQEVITS